jgi:hypothetical protein
MANRGAASAAVTPKPQAPKPAQKTAADKELLDWLALCKCERYLPQLQKLGVRAVCDFKELSESDIQALKLSKFDQKRFMEALQTSVPEFLIYNNARSKLDGHHSFSASNGSAQSCSAELVSWLQDSGLDGYLKHFTMIGVRTIADVTEMDESDISKVKLNKFDKRRFREAAQSLSAPQKKCVKPFAGLGSDKMTFQEAMLRKNPVSVSMANASQLARENCLKANLGQKTSTIGTFHNQWRAAQQARKKQMYAVQFQTASCQYGN